MKRFLFIFLLFFQVLQAEEETLLLVLNLNLDQKAFQYMNSRQQQIAVPAVSSHPMLPSVKKEFIGLWEVIKEQKLILGLGILVSFYALFLYKMIQLNHFTGQKNSWSTWKEGTPFIELLETPHHELAQELLETIQRKYANPKNPTDFLNPLIDFSNEIDQELQKLYQLQSLRSWLTFLHLDSLFPRTSTDIDEKIKRLTYLKNLFLSWATEYKMHQYTTKRSSLNFNDEEERIRCIEKLILVLKEMVTY